MGGAVLLALGLLTLGWVFVGLNFKPSLPYFEAFLNQKYDGYQKYQGRVIQCDSWREFFSEYEVSCRYFRGGTPEETTYHAFDKWGDYIGSRDGG